MGKQRTHACLMKNNNFVFVKFFFSVLTSFIASSVTVALVQNVSFIQTHRRVRH